MAAGTDPEMVDLAEIRRVVESHAAIPGVTYTTLKIADVLAILTEAERSRDAVASEGDNGDGSGTWAGLRPGVRVRLAKAVEHLMRTGSLNRADIVRIGEVTYAQASHDLSQIKARCPDLMRYDVSSKRYVPLSTR